MLTGHICNLWSLSLHLKILHDITGISISCWMSEGNDGYCKIPNDIQGAVGIKALECVTQFDGLKCVMIGNVTANPRWTKKLRTWGEAGVVKEGKDGKTRDRGEAMMFVGYPFNGKSDSV